MTSIPVSYSLQHSDTRIHDPVTPRFSPCVRVPVWVQPAAGGSATSRRRGALQRRCWSPRGLTSSRRTGQNLPEETSGSRQWAHRRPGDKSWRKWRACTISNTGLPRLFLRFTPARGGVSPREGGAAPWPRAEGPPSRSRALSSLQVSRCQRTVVGKAEHWPRVQRSNKLGLF